MPMLKLYVIALILVLLIGKRFTRLASLSSFVY